MRRTSAIFAAALVASAISVPAPAARTADFGLGVFNDSVPGISTNSAVFSPFSFELDCCIFAEACDPISRAATAECLGVLTELSLYYAPLYARTSAPTNGLAFLSAYALCLPDIRLSFIEYRRRIQELCGAGVCLSWPPTGAESFLRSMMDGQMEEFEISHPPYATSHYRYYDLVSVRGAIATNAMEKAAVKNLPFEMPDGTVREVPFLCGRANVDYCRGDVCQTVRLALDGGAWLYLIRPAGNIGFADLRYRLAPSAMRSAMASVVSLTERDAGPAVCDIAFPVLDFASVTDLAKGFQKALVPSQGFDFIHRSLTTRDASQHAKVRISPPRPPKPLPQDDAAAAGRNRDDLFDDVESTDDDDSWRKNPTEWKVPRKEVQPFVFSSPFLFIVYNPETDVVSAIGQYMGP